MNVLQHFVLFKLNIESKIEDPSDIFKDLNRKLKYFFHMCLYQTSNYEFQNNFSIIASLLQFSQVLLGHDSLIKVPTSKRHKAGRKEALFI